MTSWRVCARSVAGVREQAARDPVEWGVATRCRRGEATSGDLAVVALIPEGTLVAAIDGLGHGGEAARAARKAGAVVRESPSQDRECGGTGPELRTVGRATEEFACAW